MVKLHYNVRQKVPKLSNHKLTFVPLGSVLGRLRAMKLIVSTELKRWKKWSLNIKKLLCLKDFSFAYVRERNNIFNASQAQDESRFANAQQAPPIV